MADEEVLLLWCERCRHIHEQEGQSFRYHYDPPNMRRWVRTVTCDVSARVTNPGITADLAAALRACIATIEEWYVQDQGSYLGDAQAREMAHREVAAVRAADALLATLPPAGGRDG